MEQERVQVYTDGSSSRLTAPCWGGDRPFPGGFAFVAFASFMSTRLERFGHSYQTTNNQMELAAILSALQIIRPTSYGLDIFSDSRYCINAVTVWARTWARTGWITGTGKPVQNRALIEAICSRVDVHRAKGEVSFHYVRGHSGFAENERADFLAGQARIRQATNIGERVTLPGIIFNQKEVEGERF